MTAGARRHHCALQNRTATVDEIGQPSTSWLTVRMFRADIKYLNGLSTIKSGADTSITKVSIRALHGAFDAGQRVVCDGVVFDIQSVLPDGKRKEVDLVCVVVSG
jgi:SPP1 family predicted phage head-tail adaptor